MRILVAQTIYPGDLVLTLPLLQHLRAGFPDAILDVLVSRGMEDLVNSHPSVSEVLTYDKTGSQRGWRNVTALARNLRTRNYSLALVLPGSVRTALAVRLARIPRRIGTDQSSGILLFADMVKFPRELASSPNARPLLLAETIWKTAGGKNSVVSPLFTDIVRLDRSRNAIQRYLQLLEPLGISVKEELLRPRLYPRNDDISAVDAAMPARRGSDLIAIAPGSTWPTKRWPAEKFAGLVSTLLERGVDLVIVGGREDRVLAEQVAGNVTPDRVMNVCGRLTFLQSAELLPKK